MLLQLYIVGGSENVQKPAYVTYEWSLREQNNVPFFAKSSLMYMCHKATGIIFEDNCTLYNECFMYVE